MRRERVPRLVALAAALWLNVGSSLNVGRPFNPFGPRGPFGFLGHPAWFLALMAAVLVLATLGLVGADRSWLAHTVAGVAAVAWGIVMAVLPEPPGWWVLLLGLWLAGALAIVIGACVLLVRRTARVRAGHAVALAMWLVIPWALTVTAISFNPHERAESIGAALAGWWFLAPPVALLVWVVTWIMGQVRASAQKG